MRYKIVRFQKLMWRNMMRSTKSQKVSVLHYIYIYIYIYSQLHETILKAITLLKIKSTLILIPFTFFFFFCSSKCCRQDR